MLSGASFCVPPLYPERPSPPQPLWLATLIGPPLRPPWVYSRAVVVLLVSGAEENTERGTLSTALVSICFPSWYSQKPHLSSHHLDIHTTLLWDMPSSRVNTRLSAARKQILSIFKKKKEEKVPCQVCRENVARSDLDRHWEEFHVGSPWLIRCFCCDKGFDSNTKYYIHLRNCPIPLGEGEDRLAFNKWLH